MLAKAVELLFVGREDAARWLDMWDEFRVVGVRGL